MEYNFKLSEIITGCENGSWLSGAVFENEKHEFMYFEGKNIVFRGILESNINWRFAYYEEEL